MVTKEHPGKRVALYARVSTANGQHPEMQMAELREYAAHRGWEVVGEYVDRGMIHNHGVNLALPAVGP